MSNDPKLALVKAPELPDAVTRRGISEPQWRTLMNNLYPGARADSVLMVWDYCAARNLDPLKKPCHIVPMEVRDAKTNTYEWRDVVMPGIYEYRTTAHRTGEYLGHSEPVYGPDIDFKGVTAPEWCAMTIYRLNRVTGQRAEFPVKVFFREVVALKKEGTPNARWTRAPKQMTTKCTEAAGIREGFPEEIGGEPTAEEMDGQRAIGRPDIVTVAIDAPPSSAGLFEAASEGVRGAIEKGFAEMAFSDGAKLAKLNEFFGQGQDVDQSAQALLDWLKDEYARRKFGQPRKKEDNAKRAQAEPARDAAARDVEPPAPPAVEPRAATVAPSSKPILAPTAGEMF